MPAILLLGSFLILLIYLFIIEPLLVSQNANIPGPKLYALTKWRLALDEWRGQRTRQIDLLHRQYGPIVRIGPGEVHFNSLTALRTIYGPGSGYERSTFYRMFDVYGYQNLFTFHSSKQHADRKKLLAHAYSKSAILTSTGAGLVEKKVKQYLDLVEQSTGKPNDTFITLHYFSLDTISQFVYGSRFGGTHAMTGDESHRNLLNDILNPDRRYLSWCILHLPSLTKWMYTRTGRLERMLRPFMPMQKPATYTGIRQHALTAWQMFKEAKLRNHDSTTTAEPSIMELLWKHHVSQRRDLGLNDLEIASECADHLLAGIDTTADSLMFLIWALSLPENNKYQQNLINELDLLSAEDLTVEGIPTVSAAGKLLYLNAIIKETLRLYAPLPSSEPRVFSLNSSNSSTNKNTSSSSSSSATNTQIIDTYPIPPNTTVSMSPYSLHRNPEIFPNPLKFDPERWLPPSSPQPQPQPQPQPHPDTSTQQHQQTLQNKHFWAFSSGPRMCIGTHLAMAEMTTLIAAIYRVYSTTIAPEFKGYTPAITARFEMFYDEVVADTTATVTATARVGTQIDTKKKMIKEHECLIVFNRRDDGNRTAGI